MSTIASFEYVHVYPRFPNQVVLQWNLVNAFQSGVYKFTIFRSENRYSGFKKITTVPVVNDYKYVDQLNLNPGDPILSSVFADVFYQIIVELPNGTEVASSVVTTGRLAEKQVYLKVKEIQRKFLLLARKYIGVPCYILKLRKFGPSCPTCYDEVKKEATDSRCPSCFGTGKDKGYFDPVLVHGHFNTSTLTQNLTLERGVVENSQGIFKQIADPMLDPYDMIVEKEGNYRWIVSRQVDVSELKRIPVTQQAAVKEVPRSHVIYTFPVPEDQLVNDENKVDSEA